jgi:hypothetical protein
LKTYDIFISHAWEYSYEYNKIVEFLDSVANFSWRNYSVPEHNPKIDPESKVGERRLTRELENQVKPVNCVLIIGRMYVPHRFWVQTEIGIANYYNKPIVGIIPQAARQIPAVMQDYSAALVSWNRFSIVDAIRKHSI